MKVKTIEELTQVLEQIDAQIKHLETSSNRLFVLTECDTLSSFHVFNLCLKQFWDEFDSRSAKQLLLYKKVVVTYTDLSNRYESLLREQIDYLENVIDLDGKHLIDLAPFFFQEYGIDVIGFYNDCLKDETDKEGKSFYKLEPDYNSRTLYIDDSGETVNSYLFHSDKLNYGHYTSLLGMKNCIKSIYKLMCVVTSYPKVLLSGYTPSQDEIIKAIEFGLKQYTKNEKWDVERNLKKIAQELKPARNSSLDSNIWGLVMKNEDELYDLIITDNLGEREDKFLEHIFATKEQLIDNSSLLQKIKSTCLDEELFDIKRSVIVHQLLKSLNADNLDLFYELVLRRNIIQCEMFPELKKQHDAWLNKNVDQPGGDETSTLSEDRQSKLDEIIGILLKGNWKQPATVENVEKLLNTVFGKDTSLLDEYDSEKCVIMWNWAEGGRHNNKSEIVPANLAGFFREESLLLGTPTEISVCLFGNNKQKDNINKGDSKYSSSETYKSLISPFLKKYTNRIIRQV